MSKPISILTAIIGALALGCVFAHHDMQKYGTDFQAHPNLPAVILTDFFGASLSVLLFYFASRWFYRRKDRKLKTKEAGEDKFYEEVARELQEKTLVAGLWTKAFAEAGGDDAKARAIYIKYRVAQLAESGRQQIGEARLAKQRLEEQKRAAKKAAELQLLAMTEAAKRQTRTGGHRFAYMLLAGFCGLNTISFGICGLGAPFVQDNTLENKIYIPIFSFPIAICFGLATRYCYKETK
jgi:hypothetical protein